MSFLSSVLLSLTPAHIERKSTVQFLRNVFQKDKYARVLIQSAKSRVYTLNTDFRPLHRSLFGAQIGWTAELLGFWRGNIKRAESGLGVLDFVE